jgi:uncharacterized membrane protein
MSADKTTDEIAVDPPTARATPSTPPSTTASDSASTPSGRAARGGARGRLTGIDAARGLALIGLMAVHILPDSTDNGDPTLAWDLFAGNSAALFALLAGVGLALSTGGRTPHRGARLAADRAGLVVRAALVGAVGLVVSAILPFVPPADVILLYYAAFFLLAIPFLHLSPKALFIAAAVFGIVSPLLLQWLGPDLPESSAYNHTIVNLFTEPAGTASELLLTGTYPALPYMTYILTGLGLGRLDLRSTRVKATIAITGAALAVAARLASTVLIHAAGGYEALLESTGLSENGLDQTLVFGPEELPTGSGWWLAISSPHTSMPLDLASSLGIGMAVLGVFLLVAPRLGRWLQPLAVMGAMTLSLYTLHLLALAPEVHYDEPEMWFVLHVAAAAVFAWFWSRYLGRGPLERVVHGSVSRVRSAVAARSETTETTESAPGPERRPSAS